MRALGVSLLLLALGASARAESLEQAAARERARRLEIQQRGVDVRSVGPDDIPHAPADVNVGPEAAYRSQSTPAPFDDLEGRRRPARRELAAIYAHLRSRGMTLVEQGRTHERTCSVAWREEKPAKCDGMVARLGGLASALALQIEAAEDLGRRSWLQPGEVRAARLARIDDRSWDEIVSAVDKYVRLSRETPTAPSVDPSSRHGSSGSKKRRS